MKNNPETFQLEWPLHTLRQFAFHGCLFKMETGRRAPNGEGHYLFRVKSMGEFRQTLEVLKFNVLRLNPIQKFSFDTFFLY